MSADAAFWLKGHSMVVHQTYYPTSYRDLLAQVRRSAVNWDAVAYVIRYDDRTEMFEWKCGRWQKF